MEPLDNEVVQLFVIGFKFGKRTKSGYMAHGNKLVIEIRIDIIQTIFTLD